MKIALISDIHSNHVALTAVLAALEQHQPDALICLGDTATIGPQPKEVLTTLQTLDCVFIQGNHDAAMLNPNKAGDLNIHPSLLPNLDWSISLLEPHDVTFLESFQFTYEMNLDADKTLFCFHASPLTNIDLILATTPIEILDGFLETTNANVMAGGHTHMQMLRKHHGRLLINPGSVGNSFTEPPPSGNPTLSPWVEYAIVTCLGGAITVNFHRLPLDIEALYASIHASDMPNGDWWLEQYRYQ